VLSCGVSYVLNQHVTCPMHAGLTSAETRLRCLKSIQQFCRKSHIQLIVASTQSECSTAKAMRLLHVTDLYLKEFFNDFPPYAILSHTWEEEEVLFQDVQNSTATKRKGYAKVRGCCDLAAEIGYEWVWIDTCCIDKSSSAELSEAINSMFAWYRDSMICIVYLADVKEYFTSKGQETSALSATRWLTRGW
jgi:hypothetical protein